MLDLPRGTLSPALNNLGVELGDSPCSPRLQGQGEEPEFHAQKTKVSCSGVSAHWLTWGVRPLFSRLQNCASRMYLPELQWGFTADVGQTLYCEHLYFGISFRASSTFFWLSSVVANRLSLKMVRFLDSAEPCLQHALEVRAIKLSNTIWGPEGGGAPDLPQPHPAGGHGPQEATKHLEGGWCELRCA